MNHRSVFYNNSKHAMYSHSKGMVFIILSTFLCKYKSKECSINKGDMR